MCGFSILKSAGPVKAAFHYSASQSGGQRDQSYLCRNFPGAEFVAARTASVVFFLITIVRNYLFPNGAPQCSGRACLNYTR